jgi:hypothetical protein
VPQAVHGVVQTVRDLGSARQTMLWSRAEQLPLPEGHPANDPPQEATGSVADAETRHSSWLPQLGGVYRQPTATGGQWRQAQGSGRWGRQTGACLAQRLATLWPRWAQPPCGV